MGSKIDWELLLFGGDQSHNVPRIPKSYLASRSLFRLVELLCENRFPLDGTALKTVFHSGKGMVNYARGRSACVTFIPPACTAGFAHVGTTSKSEVESHELDPIEMDRQCKNTNMNETRTKVRGRAQQRLGRETSGVEQLRRGGCNGNGRCDCQHGKVNSVCEKGDYI